MSAGSPRSSPRAVRDVAHEMGEWASDAFDMREAADHARAAADDESSL